MRGWNEIIWAQFDAAITTLRNAIDACPASAWGLPCGRGEFWHSAFHTLFFLDLYLDESRETFEARAPFTTSELEEGALPPKVYTKDELLSYLEHCRSKCRSRIEALTDLDLEQPAGFEWLKRRGMSVAECMLYNLRHVQHHAAQLNLVLRQAEGHGADWVHRTVGP